ncbi:MAG TPA: alkaline phosphatase family protein [Burkholderiaceae bacterium]|nr:alkaline phosphatase family protein [Burkholderiaceae bacterium]
MNRSVGLAMTLVAGAVSQAYAQNTPIQHVIVIVGENHTFDNVFGTYQPSAGQKISNLLSKGIVNADGSPGPHHSAAAQRIGLDTGKYAAATTSTGKYATLPQPWTSGALGQPSGVLDTRFPADLPNGPFQISWYVPFVAYTGDPVHRFYQMWQETDGGAHDKFAWVESTIGTGSNGNPPPPGGFNPKEGSISMGFYNMNPYIDASGTAQPGDLPVIKSFADNYAISDNYHQAIMGGTGANFQAIVAADAAFFTNPDGSAGTPYGNQIENPDAWKGTNNYYKQDGYGGGSYVGCFNPKLPGIKPVLDQLKQAGVNNPKCDPGHYYLVNNYNMYWNQDGSTNTLGSDKFVLPPQSNSTIATVLDTANVSWKYYSADQGSDTTRYATEVDGISLPFHSYCGICDPLRGYTSVMTGADAQKLTNYGAFQDDLAAGTLPSVSFVRPFEALAGHPGDSTQNLYELFLQDLVAQVQANPSLWATTAIVMTEDEGGGYYDSGYIQPVDFFGDGTRIPFIVVSPFAKKGFVDHTYYDHASIAKFIEANWGTTKISARSRDNLPNPVASKGDPYVPVNGPAVGDLMNMFDFGKK